MKILTIIFLLQFLSPSSETTSCLSTMPILSPKASGFVDLFNNNSDSISYKIIDGIDHTYGYDLYKNNNKIIHQPSIPCIKGNKGFSRKNDARKVALLVIKKLRKNIMPPTLTVQEMKSMGVVF